MNKIRVKLNYDLKSYKKGDLIFIDSHDIYWRKRLQDAKSDNCIEIISEKPREKKIIKISKKERKVLNKKTIKLEREFDENY